MTIGRSERVLARLPVVVIASIGPYLLWLSLVFGGVGAFFAWRTDLTAVGSIAGAMTLGLLVGWRTHAAQHRESEEQSGPSGVPVSQSDAGALWPEMRRIARGVDAVVPDEVRMVMGTEAEVVDDGGLWGLRRGTRRMYVGAGLLVVDRAELRAVLAHELALRSRRIDQRAPLVYRVHRFVEALAIRSADPASQGSSGRSELLVRLLDKPFDLAARWYLAASGPLVRAQEAGADVLTAEVVGTRATVLALRRAPALRRAWDAYRQEALLLGIEVGLRPRDAPAGFADFLLCWPDGDDPQKCAIEGPGPTDGPDSLASRLDRLAGADRPGTFDPDAARPLLADSAAVLGELADLWYQGTRLRPVEWPDLVHEATLREARALGGLLQGPVGRAVAVFAWGGARDLVPMIPRDASADEVRETAQTLLSRAIETLLVDECGARLALSWRDGVHVVLAGERVHVRSLVDACDRGVVERQRLAQFVRSQGLDELCVPMQDDLWRRPPLRAGFLFLAYAPRIGRGRVLGVTEEAMVVSRVPRGSWAWLPDIGAQHGATSYRFLRRIDAAGPERLMAHPTAEVVSWDQVVEARLGARQRLRVRLANGRRIKLALEGKALGEDSAEVLRYVLGDRLT